ncbi:Permease of the drug/metabolite transporter (DMT) superfamily [Rhodovastum atsumiense]|uniref:DMT family transporter n=1 Tax=Rhodovastum atsumiense TaxID=504468 RepID=A0A5M6ILB2_9PROT|nr:DMT family transporter [Rhodovastum atsumiense]KAA5609063.1 DMT family transporter [Rhodovastum atsumiense]CAH2602187.1 Permease of the drug/metabolite transporter (DMT) superfamily [Rhodovastum atsumiense]
MRKNGELGATAIGGVAVLLWSALALLTVQAGGGLPPFELLALSFGIAFLAGLAMLGLRGRAALAELRQPLAPWLLAFCGIFFYHALYFFALSAVPAAQASLIAYLWPLLIVLMAALLPGGERLRARHLGGALLGLAGTALILAARGGDGTTAGSVAGYAASFGCAFVWSGYSVLNRRFAATPASMLVGVCGAVAVAGAACHLAFEATAWPRAEQWAAIIGLGVGPTGLAFLAWDHATKHGRLPLLGALSYLSPLLSTLLLIAAGKASASGPLLPAAVLVIGGALLATGLPARRRQRARCAGAAGGSAGSAPPPAA